MAGTGARTWRREAWKLAKRQHWVIARDQLIDLGATRSEIEHRLRTRRFHRLFRGVYAVGRPDPGPLGWAMAATLAAGAEAFVSDRSAAGLMCLTRSPSLPVHVSVRGSGGLRRRSNVIVHHRASAFLTPELTGAWNRIPVTAPGPTIIDIASNLSLNELDAAVTEADKRDLIAPGELRDLAAAQPRRPGARKVRQALDRHTFVLADSALERIFVPLAMRAGLGVPLTQRYENSHRVDFLFPDLGLVVETDGLRYHRTPGQQSSDLRRDQDHAAAGLERLRFSHWQVKNEPGRVVEVLAAVATRLRSAA